MAAIGTYYAAKGSRATVAGVNLYKTDWDVEDKTDPIDTSNFECGGFYQYIIGLEGADYNIKGLWEVGTGQFISPPGLFPRFDLGQVNLYLSVSGSLSWSLPQSVVSSAKNSAAVKDAVKFEAALMANGIFTRPNG